MLRFQSISGWYSGLAVAPRLSPELFRHSHAPLKVPESRVGMQIFEPLVQFEIPHPRIAPPTGSLQHGERPVLIAQTGIDAREVPGHANVFVRVFFQLSQLTERFRPASRHSITISEPGHRAIALVL